MNATTQLLNHFSIMNSEDVDFKTHPRFLGKVEFGRASANTQTERVVVNRRARFTGRPVEFKLRSSACLEVPVAERQKRNAAAPGPPRICLKIKTSGNALVTPVFVIKNERIEAIPSSTFGFEAPWNTCK